MNTVAEFNYGYLCALLDTLYAAGSKPGDFNLPAGVLVDADSSRLTVTLSATSGQLQLTPQGLAQAQLPVAPTGQLAERLAG